MNNNGKKTFLKRMFKLNSRVHLILATGFLLIIGSATGEFLMLTKIRSSINSIQQTQIQVSRLQQMEYLDEVLTLSVSYYVFTKNEKWKNQYFEHTRELVKLQDQMNAFLPNIESDSSISSIEEQASIFSTSSIEKQAIELVAMGETDNAFALLVDDKYLTSKDNFKNRMAKIREDEDLSLDVVQQNLEGLLSKLSYTFLFTSFLVGGFLILLGILWQTISKMLRKNQALSSNLELSVSKEKKSEKVQTALLKDLEQYAHLTSHSLRAPLARMQGVMTLITMRKDELQLSSLLVLLKASSEEMEKITMDMNEILTRNSYDKVIE